MIELACPRCHSPLEPFGPAGLRCPHDGGTYDQVDGIWRMLLPGRLEFYARFIQDYEMVRRLEGRSSGDPAYYRTLPYHDSEAWRIRARSFEALMDRVVQPLESPGRPLRILDLGAGNGWLSHRLAARGHDVAAMDLTVNDFDGLGCASRYDARFLPVQAEFDSLPLPDRSVDLVLFNASLHYSTDYGTTLKESMRVLLSGGRILVLDSPIYHDPESGRRMIAEREAQFSRQYGFPSNNLPSEGYLTWDRIEQLASANGLQVGVITPSYGLRWNARPLVARLLRRREPAGFHIVVFSEPEHSGPLDPTQSG